MSPGDTDRESRPPKPQRKSTMLEFPNDAGQQEADVAPAPAPAPGPSVAKPAKPPRPPVKSKGRVADTARPFQPANRPPMALICVVDSGPDGGQWIRMRGESTVIGRTQGDIQIMHDHQISSKHAEICRQRTEEGFTWLVRDLGSSNGTLVRVDSHELEHGSEVAIGGRRYRFELPRSSPEELETPPEPPTGEQRRNVTQGWQDGAAPSPGAGALLTELSHDEEGRRFILSAAQLIGADRRCCGVVIDDDPLVSAAHASIEKDDADRWTIRDQRSLNGTWVKVEQKEFAERCEVWCGEQRFIVSVVP